MRIVGGTHKGRALLTPATAQVRPTSDRLREAMFNILAHSYGDPATDARVIDLFAGTGALGIEALSRGAEFVLFVDDSSEARALLRGNIDALGLGGVTRIFRRNACNLGDMPPQEPFTLAFIDPPYGKGLTEQALASLLAGGWLAKDALVIIEENSKADVELPDVMELVETRSYGKTKLLIARAT